MLRPGVFSCESTPSVLPVALGLALAAGIGAQSRGGLEIRCTPDSASVFLDGGTTPEIQKTPYINDKMLPGDHNVVLRSPNPAHLPVRTAFRVDAGQRQVLSPSFEYRNKSFDGEHLSLAPMKAQIGLGFEYLSYLALKSPSSLPVDQASAVAGAISGNYPSDSTPSSLRMPLVVRLGMPGGWESHFEIPLASRTETDGSGGGMGIGDASFGMKWTSIEWNSAADLSWIAGNANASHLGRGARGLQLALITNQRMADFDLYAQLGYLLSLGKTTSPGSVGDQVSARARIGYVLKDALLPFAQADLAYRLPNTFGSPDSSSSAFLLKVMPGVVWQRSSSFALELGIPLGLLASNGETRVGVNLSFTKGFSLPKLGSAVKVAAPKPVAAAYGKTIAAAGSTHVLFESREVSNAQYREFCDKTGREYPQDPDFAGIRDYFTSAQYADFPVVSVSLDDARAYARWQGRRLPTASEWTREFSESSVPPEAVACGLEMPERVDSRNQGAGQFNYLGNVAEWVESDRGTGNSAYIAGGFYGLPTERCLDKNRSIEIASPSGSKFIGFRLVTELK